MNAIRASILFSAGKLNVTSTCSFSSSELVGPVAAGDAAGRAGFSVPGEAFGVASGAAAGVAAGVDCAVGLSRGVALTVSIGDGLTVV